MTVLAVRISNSRESAQKCSTFFFCCFSLTHHVLLFSVDNMKFYYCCNIFPFRSLLPLLFFSIVCYDSWPRNEKKIYVFNFLCSFRFHFSPASFASFFCVLCLAQLSGVVPCCLHFFRVCKTYKFENAQLKVTGLEHARVSVGGTWILIDLYV